MLQDYFSDGSGKGPRYYQATAVNAATEAIAKGQQRLLLVMATGTGKTYTAFQIIWRLWKAGRKKRILFLADRNILVDQTMINDFQPFGAAMTKLSTGSKVIEREDGSSVICPRLSTRGAGSHMLEIRSRAGAHDHRYRSPIPPSLQWRAWAADPEGITGDALLAFVNNDLFPA